MKESEEIKKVDIEEVKKGDVEESKTQEDIELVVDPEKETKRKHYGTKLVDGGGCTAQV